MNRYILTMIAAFWLLSGYGQDSLFTYSKVFTIDSVSKDELFNRSLVWCSKSFKESKNAVDVKEREGGIIGGKAQLDNYYEYPNKNGKLILGVIYADYNFNWGVQIKDGKVKFSTSDIIIKYASDQYQLTTSATGPAKIMMLSQQRNDAEWKASKEHFIKVLDYYMDQLQKELNTNSDF